jgi:hypothetical protein
MGMKPSRASLLPLTTGGPIETGVLPPLVISTSWTLTLKRHTPFNDSEVGATLSSDRPVIVSKTLVECVSTPLVPVITMA